MIKAKKTNILGINYSKITHSGLLKEIENNQDKITISLAPVDSVMLSRKNPALKKIYNSFDYVLADGSYIVFASKLLRNPLPGQILGPELFPSLIDLCSRKGYSVYFLGSDEETIKKVNEKLSKNILVKGHHCPPFKKRFNSKDNKLMIDKINKARPDFLFVIFGAPKQDIWIQENKNKIDAKVIVPVGAAFDFYAEKAKRAPRWMQKASLEWFFRLISEPKRLWKRYARDFWFPFLIIKESIKSINKKNL
jgi:N-acetylglucosaminyldiphosphoundecaprenol N-acetyl-beta-D-mannosaminyltransferase